MNRNTSNNIQPLTTGHFQKRVAAFRFLGSIAVISPVVALIHKWMESCEVSVLTFALSVVALCGVLMRLIDFKKQIDPNDITPSQSIFNRLGTLDPQYEYDRNIKWLKLRWIAFVGLVSMFFILVDLICMKSLCEGAYSYASLTGSADKVQIAPKQTN